MIWATFEHVGNTPNAAYSYVATGGTMKSVAQTTAGTWLFSKTGAGAPFNSEHMTFVSPNIVASSGNTISPSNTLRLNAWGANPSVAPNPVDATTAASNSEIISINNSVRGMMPAGDPRDNYFTTGATWTVNGFAPTGSFSGSVSNGIEVGTSQMANSTMETYQQFPSMNCFACHGRGSGTVNPNLSAAMDNNPISHIYQVIKPLF
jgi:mono/diheme cytochrome c family protein